MVNEIANIKNFIFFFKNTQRILKDIKLFQL